MKGKYRVNVRRKVPTFCSMVSSGLSFPCLFSPGNSVKVELKVLLWKIGKLINIIRVKHLKDRDMRRRFLPSHPGEVKHRLQIFLEGSMRCTWEVVGSTALAGSELLMV